MAYTSVTRVHTKLNEGSVLAPTSVTGDFKLDLMGADYKTAFLFTNAGASAVTVTVPVGNGLQGVGDSITISVGAGKTAVLTVDSGAYKTVSGDHAGYLVGNASGALSVAVVELP